MNHTCVLYWSLLCVNQVRVGRKYKISGLGCSNLFNNYGMMDQKCSYIVYKGSGIQCIMCIIEMLRTVKCEAIAHTCFGFLTGFYSYFVNYIHILVLKYVAFYPGFGYSWINFLLIDNRQS